jgi:uncharacterized membrane protein (UPF0127 family)
MSQPRARVVRAASPGSPARAVCERCFLADNAWSRMRGLLGRGELARDEGLLIRPTWSIHMFFMRFPIDAVFVDREGVVVRIVPGLAPWRMASHRGAKAVLELAAGEAARRGLELGERIELVDA